MYEAQKAEFERLLVKSELEPTPGNYWLKRNTDTWRYEALDGKCCALTPAMLEHRDYVLDAGVSLVKLAEVYNMPYMWFQGALMGFDAGTDAVELFTGDNKTIKAYSDGCEWGRYMRAKYVRETAPQ